MVDEGLRVSYRVAFGDSLVYEIEVTDRSASDLPVFTALIYRMLGSQRESTPLHRGTGKLMEFHAATARSAMQTACEVLQLVNGRAPTSIVEVERPG
jgi:hypothetical protein